MTTNQHDDRTGNAFAPLLVSRIPEGHPMKAAVEAALQDVLASYEGEWQCRIDPSPNQRGWSLRLFGVGDHASLVLVVRPEQQDPATVANWVIQILDRRRSAPRPQADDRRRGEPHGDMVKRPA